MGIMGNMRIMCRQELIESWELKVENYGIATAGKKFKGLWSKKPGVMS